MTESELTAEAVERLVAQLAPFTRADIESAAALALRLDQAQATARRRAANPVG